MSEQHRWRGARRFLALTAFCACLLGISSSAQAQVQVDAEPVFGEACVPSAGGTELIVGLSNTTGNVFRGTAKIEAGISNGRTSTPEVAFMIAAGGHATLRIPTPVATVGAGDSVLIIGDEHGRALAQKPLQYVNPSRGLLVDATPEGRIAFSLRSLPQADPYAPLGARVNETRVQLPENMTVCPALRAPHTGDLVLPRSSIGYNGVAMVMLDGDSLSRLPAAERVALGDYVLAGGQLLLIPTSRDQFREPVVEAFVGKGVHEEPMPAITLSEQGWLRTNGTEYSFPRADTFSNAMGFAGGNLVETMLDRIEPWLPPGAIGRTARYGLGLVHVLTFNPAKRPAIEDPWSMTVVARLVGMIAQHDTSMIVRDSDSILAVPSPVRRALDPNEGFRSSLGLAVVLLVLYAAIAGPITFKIASRRGRPLRGVALLPVWSVALFGVIVLMGGLSRSWQGRSRRVGVMELPAGMSRGMVRRYRGFFSGDAGLREVTAMGPDRRLYDDPNSARLSRRMVLEPGRTRLLNVELKPWTTTVVREEGVDVMEGTVDLVPEKDTVRVVNRLRYPLKSVILIAPDGDSAAWFDEIAPGASRTLKEGKQVSAVVLAALGQRRGFDRTENSEYYVPTSVQGNEGADWHPGESVASLFGSDKQQAMFWDAAVTMVPGIGASVKLAPVLVAQVVRPPVASDGGLRVDMDVLFLRVTGWGGQR